MDTQHYRIAVTETRRKIVTVDARSPKEAYSRARDAWHNTEIILNADDFEGVEFDVLEATDQTDEKDLTLIDRKEI